MHGHETLSVNDQMEDLRERMRLLQGDRKANIDILEASKSSNKEEIRHLREENKDIRHKLSQLVKGSARGEETAEFDHAQREVHRLRKIYNDYRSRASVCQKSLQQLKDEVKDLELESRQPNREDSPLARKIRMLENRLDKAMIKYNEAQSIRKTYEQIVKRLKARDHRVGFDNQLGAVERTLQAKVKDYEELLLLSGDANHAREVAQTELDRVRRAYNEERRRREAELREKHQIVQLRKQLKDQADRRAQIRAEIMAMNDETGEQRLKMVSLAADTVTAKMTTELVSHKTKIDVFENAFRKIKYATGVSDVNEVIQKIISQDSTAESLMNLTKENQGKIESLHKRKAALKVAVEDLKYTGPGEGHRRKMVDDLEELLLNSLARLERVRNKHERQTKVLVAVKAGVEHLQDKLKTTADEVGVETMATTDETVVDVLEVAQKVLVKVSERIKVNEHEKLADSNTGDGPSSLGTRSPSGDSPREGSQTRNKFPWADGAGGGADAMIGSEEGTMHLRPYNQRIELPSVEDLSEGECGRPEGGEVGDDDGGTHDFDEDELTRDKVKKAATKVLSQQEKKNKPKRKQGRGAD
ncbi:unnamed protein product [Ascophyllum nodosum]